MIGGLLVPQIKKEK